MAFLRNKWAVAALVMLCWAIVTSFTTGYYYSEYMGVKGIYLRTLSELSDVSIKANICVDYGNGTQEWHNSTLLPIGASLFNATAKVAKVEYKVYPEMGIFITSIDGVENNADKNLWWLWFYWNATTMEWGLGPVGCDSWILHNGDTVMWNYTSPPW